MIAPSVAPLHSDGAYQDQWRPKQLHAHGMPLSRYKATSDGVFWERFAPSVRRADKNQTKCLGTLTSLDTDGTTTFGGQLSSAPPHHVANSGGELTSHDLNPCSVFLWHHAWNCVRLQSAPCGAYSTLQTWLACRTCCPSLNSYHFGSCVSLAHVAGAKHQSRRRRMPPF